MKFEQTTTVLTTVCETVQIVDVMRMLSKLKDYTKDHDLVSRETGQCFTECIGECIDLLEALSHDAIQIY